MTITVACIQNNASSDLEHNIKVCSDLIREAANQGASFITTPECFAGFESIDALLSPIAFSEHQHPVIKTFAALAKELAVDLLLGSVGIKLNNGRLQNRSLLINAQGKIIAQYNKIHLFDVDLGEGKVFTESATIDAGNAAVIVPLGAMTLGMSICYDLCFPHLYRSLAQAGANVLCVPAAFTQKTGRAHWHILNRARAIENTCFVIAANQTGPTPGGGASFGHSLIIDPWGEILADAGEDQGIITASIDLDYAAECQRRIPSMHKQTPFSL